MKNKILGMITLMFFSTLGFGETLQSLPKDKILELIKGNTVTTMPLITMNNEQVSNTLTGYFGEDGKISANVTNKLDNAPQQDNGTWEVDDNGLLCMTWQHWKAVSTPKVCVRLYEVNNGYVLVNQDGNFESIIKKPIMKGNQVK